MMYKRMYRSVFLLCTVSLAMLGATAWASAELWCNGQPLALPNQNELSWLFGQPDPEEAIAPFPFACLFPLMEEIHEIVLQLEGSQLLLQEENLAEKVWNWSACLSSGKLVVSIPTLGENPVQWVRLEGIACTEKELEIWLSREGVLELREQLQRFADWFGVSLHILEIPDIPARLQAYLRAQEPLPDVFHVEPSQLEELVDFQAVQGLGYLFSQDSQRLQSLQPNMSDAFLVNGVPYAYPFYADTQMAFVNRELAGRDFVLQDETDLWELAARLGSSDAWACSWNAYSLYWLVPFLRGFGMDPLLGCTNTVDVQHPAVSQAIDFLLALRDQGLLLPEERDAMTSLFCAGEVALILSGSYMVPQFERLEMEVGMFALPWNSRGGRWFSPVLDCKGLAISARTKVPVLSRRVIDFLSCLPVQQRFCEQLRKIPARREALDRMSLPGELQQVFRKSLRTGFPLPTASSYGIWKSVFWKILRFVFAGQMSVTQALQSAQQLVDANLSY